MSQTFYQRDISYLAKRPVADRQEIISNHLVMCEKRLIFDMNDNLFEHYLHEQEIASLKVARESATTDEEIQAIDKEIRLHELELKKGANFSTLTENDIVSVKSYPITPILLISGPKRKFFDYQVNNDGNGSDFCVAIDNGAVRVYWYKELYELSYELYVIAKNRDDFLETCDRVASFFMSYNRMTVNNEHIEVEESPQLTQEQIPTKIDLETDFLIAKGGIKLKYISQWKVTDTVETEAVDSLATKYQRLGDDYADKTIAVVNHQFT